MKKYFLNLSLLILSILPIGLFYAQISDTIPEKTNIDRNILNLNQLQGYSKCLDGSPYGIYYAEGYDSGKNKIILNFRQGGWCKGRDKNSFFEDCIKRSKTDMGSSKNWSKIFKIEDGFLGGDSNRNSNFFNWNRFDFPYCDGTGHQGLIKDPVKINKEFLYFKGHLNSIEGFNFIFHKVKIEDIEELVVTGCSAGGLATFYWIQYLADFIQKKNKKVKIYGIPDSGFFIDHKSLKTNKHEYKLQQNVLFKIVNKEVLPVNRECINHNLHNMHNCLLAEYLIKYIKVPFLILQPGYDWWQMINILNLVCAKNNNINECNEENLKFAHEYKNYQTLLINKELDLKNNLSAWSPSCVRHCFKGKIDSHDWEVPKDSGNNINFIVKKFLESEGKVQVKLFDKVDWPKNDKCLIKGLKFLID